MRCLNKYRDYFDVGVSRFCVIIRSGVKMTLSDAGVNIM